MDIYYFSSHDKGVSIFDVVVLPLVIGDVLDGHGVLVVAGQHLGNVITKNGQVVVLILLVHGGFILGESG